MKSGGGSGGVLCQATNHEMRDRLLLMDSSWETR